MGNLKMYLECFKSYNGDVERKVEKGSFNVEEILASIGYIIFRIYWTHLEGQTLRIYIVCTKMLSSHLQLSKSDYKRLLHKPYVNEVHLTGQNPPLNCCQHLEIQYTVRKRVDLLMLKILGL